MFKDITSKIQKGHSKLFRFLSTKAESSKWWSALLTFAILYEIIEHLVYPWFVPYMAYLTWFN